MDWNQLWAVVKIPFVFLGDLIHALYAYIFPEYPEIGLWVVLATLVIVWIQMRRTDTGRAIEIGLLWLLGLSIALFLVHLLLVLMKRGGAFS